MKKKLLLCSVLFLIVGVLFSSVSYARLGKFKAKITDLQGIVQVKKSGGEKSYDAFKGMDLIEGYSIITGHNSWVKIDVTESRNIKISENSIVLVNELSKINSKEVNSFSLWSGVVWANVRDKLNVNSKFEIKTPTAIMGVRGTQLYVKHDNGKSEFALLTGKAAIKVNKKDRDNKSEQEVNLEKNMKIEVKENTTDISKLKKEELKLQDLDLFVVQTIKETIQETNGTTQDEAKTINIQGIDNIDKVMQEKQAIREQQEKEVAKILEELKQEVKIVREKIEEAISKTTEPKTSGTSGGGGTGGTGSNTNNNAVAPVVSRVDINATATNRNFTNERMIKIDIEATNATHVMISESSNFSGGTWETYTSNKDFTLSYGDGEKTIYVKCKNSEGTESNVNSSKITLDTQAPVIKLEGNVSTTININKGSAYSHVGAVVTDNYSTGLTATITGTVNTNAVGTYTVTYTATDEAGNTGRLERIVTVVDPTVPDITPPTLTITANPSANPTNASSITYTFSFSEPVTGFDESDITVSNGMAGNFTGNGSTYTLVVNYQADGVQHVGVIAGSCTDFADNGNIAAVKTVTIDKTPPTAPTFSMSPTTMTNGNVTLTITYPADANTKQYKIGTNGTWTNYTAPLTITNNDTIYTKVSDAAGNINTSEKTITNIDKTSPTATVEYSTTNPTNANVTATIYADKTIIVTNNGGQTSYTFTANGSFVFYFTDAVGNTGSATAIVSNIDKVAPSEPTANVASGTYSTAKTVTISGETGATIRYTLDGSIPTTSSTKYTSAITLNTSVTLKVAQWDAAGNMSPVSEYIYTINVPQAANAPVYATNMQPVKWTGSAWSTDVSGTTWYDYRIQDASVTNTNKNFWANVRLSDGSMYVWIPRYTYKIESDATNLITGKQVKIKYSNGITDDNTNAYISHPAFNFGGTQLAGIWVAKFEASSSNGQHGTNGINVQTIPGKWGWRDLSISQAFDKSIAIKSVLELGLETNVNTHLIKNTEWGAVVYLMDAVGIDSPAWVGSPYTGGSQLTSEVYTTNINQSTTKNATGIYDMAGGLGEYVSAYIDNGSSKLSLYGNSLLSSSVSYANKYVTKFTGIINGITGTSNDTYNNIYSQTNGMAIHEVFSGHNFDLSVIPYGDFPFMTRGGYATSSDIAIYSVIAANGFGNTNIGFRPVIVVTP